MKLFRFPNSSKHQRLKIPRFLMFSFLNSVFNSMYIPQIEFDTRGQKVLKGQRHIEFAHPDSITKRYFLKNVMDTSRT